MALSLFCLSFASFAVFFELVIVARTMVMATWTNGDWVLCDAFEQFGQEHGLHVLQGTDDQQRTKVL